MLVVSYAVAHRKSNEQLLPPRHVPSCLSVMSHLPRIPPHFPDFLIFARLTFLATSHRQHSPTFNNRDLPSVISFLHLLELSNILVGEINKGGDGDSAVIGPGPATLGQRQQSHA